jgi:hypothetical protein
LILAQEHKVPNCSRVAEILYLLKMQKINYTHEK